MEERAVTLNDRDQKDNNVKDILGLILAFLITIIFFAGTVGVMLFSIAHNFPIGVGGGVLLGAGELAGLITVFVRRQQAGLQVREIAPAAASQEQRSESAPPERQVEAPRPQRQRGGKRTQ
jgi:hypothetical protein